MEVVEGCSVTTLPKFTTTTNSNRIRSLGVGVRVAHITRGATGCRGRGAARGGAGRQGVQGTLSHPDSCRRVSPAAHASSLYTTALFLFFCTSSSHSLSLSHFPCLASSSHCCFPPSPLSTLVPPSAPLPTLLQFYSVFASHIFHTNSYFLFLSCIALRLLSSRSSTSSSSSSILGELG